MNVINEVMIMIAFRNIKLRPKCNFADCIIKRVETKPNVDELMSYRGDGKGYPPLTSNLRVFYEILVKISITTNTFEIRISDFWRHH